MQLKVILVIKIERIVTKRKRDAISILSAYLQQV